MLPSLVLTPPKPSLFGAWRAEFVAHGKRPPPSSDRLSARLVLRADGTFVYRLANHVPSALILDAKGTYRIRGAALVLEGTGRALYDDMRPGRGVGPFVRTLRFAKGRLTEEEPWRGYRIVFHRGGSSGRRFPCLL